MKGKVNGFITFPVLKVGTQLKVAMTVSKNKGQTAVYHFLHLPLWVGWGIK